MRLEHSTLGHLSTATLRREAQIAADCIELAGIDESESIAKSFGL